MHQSILKHQVRLYDHRCLVTGAVSTQLRACRLVDTICTKESNREKELLVRILVIPETLGGGRIFLSRNTSSPDNSLDPGSFPWTARRIMSFVSVVVLC